MAFLFVDSSGLLRCAFLADSGRTLVELGDLVRLRPPQKGLEAR